MSGFILVEDRILSAASDSETFNTGLTAFTRFRLTVFVVAAGGQILLRFNGDDGTNYARQYVTAVNSTVAGARQTGATSILSPLGVATGLLTAEIAKPLTTTPARATLSLGVHDGSVPYLGSYVGEWNNTADLISSITILSSSGDFAAGTRILLEAS